MTDLLLGLQKAAGFCRLRCPCTLLCIFFGRRQCRHLPRSRRKVSSVVITPLQKIDPIRFHQIGAAVFLRNAS